MAHLLMLTPQVPYPPRQGTALRNWGLLRGLATQHQISLLSFFAPDQDPIAPAAITGIVERVVLIPQPTRTIQERLRDLLTNPRPDLTLRLKSAAFQTQLVDWLERFKFDWVQVEGLELAPYLETVWARPSPPRVIFDDHNCEYVLQKRAFVTDIQHPMRWIGAAYSFVQWRRLYRYERDICRRADLVVAVSGADARVLRVMDVQLAPLVVPNGIHVAEYAHFTQAESLQQPAFVFTGTMDFRPNVDGVLWFADHVWPSIREALPSASFYIVGRRPHARLDALRELPGIVITGGVLETRSYIRAAAVYVVPLWVGGGTRLKILEAAAMGKAIVSTTLGAEGFPQACEAMVLADDPVAFADACIRLSLDAVVREQQNEKAIAFASMYDWDVLLPTLLEKL
ncbi:MAG: glycosyltransferase [Anaerolineae bacterium]|nr:glycosyltransferase [Anaerolineae bacterium]